MDYVRYLIEHHGNLFYLLTFVWTALEGETFVVFAGLAAQKGMLNVYWLFLAAWSGSFVGDQTFFWIGRKYGAAILGRLPKLKAPIDRSLGWLERHAAAFILAYRFMYGVRNVSGFAIGMSHLPWQKFAFWNCIAACVWAASFCGVGYAFGGMLFHFRRNNDGAEVEDSVRQMTIAVLGLFMLIVAFRLVVMVWQKHRIAQRARMQ